MAYWSFIVLLGNSNELEFWQTVLKSSSWKIEAFLADRFCMNLHSIRGLSEFQKIECHLHFWCFSDF
eukprot:c39089_g1_i1 orf=352-552(+)